MSKNNFWHYKRRKNISTHRLIKDGSKNVVHQVILGMVVGTKEELRLRTALNVGAGTGEEVSPSIPQFEVREISSGRIVFTRGMTFVNIFPTPQGMFPGLHGITVYA